MSPAPVRVRDVEEARAVGSQLFFDHRLEAGQHRDRFAMDVAVSQLGTLRAGVVHYFSEVTAHVGGEEDAYGVIVPQEDSAHAAAGDDRALVNTSTAFVVRPDGRSTALWWPGGTSPISLLRFDRFAVEAALRGVLGKHVKGPLRLDAAIDLTASAGQRWWELARFISTACRSAGGSAMNPLQSAPLESTLTIGLLLATRHQYSDDLQNPGRSIPPEQVRRALAIIDERPDQPLTMPAIAAEVGCSLRTLQLGFEKHVGMTPRARLSQVRLDRVHRDLVVGTPETTSVREIASRWGISNFGRFAHDYRRVYGVLPSATLRNG